MLRAATGPSIKTRALRMRWCSSSIPEDSDWWLVEGVPISVQDIRTVKKSDEKAQSHPRFSKKINHLSTQRVPEQEDQRNYWKEYLRIYENARDEWEKLAWDKPKVVHCVDDDFFDAPLVRNKKKKKTLPADRKPFSMEEIQAAIRENVRHPASDRKIEYRTAADTKWPF